MLHPPVTEVFRLPALHEQSSLIEEGSLVVSRVCEVGQASFS